jgi:transposase
VKRFADMRQVVSYVGLHTVEHSSDNQNKRRRYGKISKHGDRMLRWSLVQSAVAATRYDPRLKRFYSRLLHRKGIVLTRV